jgi:hypothetical protein
MNKSNPPDAGLAKSSFAKQATSFVRDFASFAGLNGVWAAALAVIAAAFESIGLLLLVPLLSIVTAADADAGRTHRFVMQGFDIFGELDPRPTIVMIAHQSLAYCDRMLRFENGRFVGNESPVTV